MRSRAVLAATASVLLLAFLISGCGDPPPKAPEGTLRNVVILTIDTLRADHLSSYGYPRDTSPNIDALADSGILFESVLAHSNWTVPATASLLTSLYPAEHGAELTGDMRLMGDGSPPKQLRKEVKTLGQILDDAGYRTALLSANPFLYGRFKRGFDLSDVGRQPADELTDKALDFISHDPTEPFFVYMQYMDLHQPIQPPDRFFHHFKVDVGGTRGEDHVDWMFGQQTDLDDPEFLRFKAHKIAVYDGALLYVDDQIGRLLAQLEDMGLRDETLIVVTSDHGEEFWDHARIEHELGGDPRDIWGVGHGHSMFQELVEVPMIFHGPGVLPQRISCAVRHLELAPTVLSLLDVAVPTEMRGTNLAPMMLQGQGDGECQEWPLLADSPAYGPDSQTVIWAGRKLIVRSDGVELLYDLRRDPQELNDLSKDNPEVVRALRAILADEMAAGPAAGEGRETMEFDAETREQLKALGYL